MCSSTGWIYVTSTLLQCTVQWSTKSNIGPFMVHGSHSWRRYKTHFLCNSVFIINHFTPEIMYPIGLNQFYVFALHALMIQFSHLSVSLARHFLDITPYIYIYYILCILYIWIYFTGTSSVHNNKMKLNQTLTITWKCTTFRSPASGWAPYSTIVQVCTAVYSW